MKLTAIIRILFLLALPLSLSAPGSASTLQGKVIEILDGERISVLSVNQPLTVKLLAVAAPGGSQAYAVAARQHLTDLVSGKYVVVQYTSLEHGFVLGRVLLKDMDVGEQMIRDGVAWYDKSAATNFSEQDKQAYLGCEQAARSEARGLWQDPAPVAPWDFRRQEAASRSFISKAQELPVKSARGSKQPLSSDDLYRSMSSGTAFGTARFDATDSGWKTLTPRPGKFSVFVPGNAVDFGATIPTPTGKTVDVNYCFGRRGTKSYLVIWARGPSDGVPDDQVADDTANGFAFGLGRGTTQAGNPFTFEVKRQRSVRLGPYSGWQYSVSAPGVPGTMRVFSRRIGQVREIYVLAALNGTEADAQILEFLGSFTIEKY